MSRVNLSYKIVIFKRFTEDFVVEYTLLQLLHFIRSPSAVKRGHFFSSLHYHCNSDARLLHLIKSINLFIGFLFH